MRSVRAMRFVISGIVALVSADALAAQATAKPMPPEQRICDMSMRVIAMRLVDRSGTPIADAGLTVRRVRTRAAVPRAEAMGGGDYKILEDGTLTDLRKGGEPFEVAFTRAGGRRKVVRLVIGMDAGGCHVELKRGATTVTM
jgi:hypothetical protein